MYGGLPNDYNSQGLPAKNSTKLPYLTARGPTRTELLDAGARLSKELIEIIGCVEKNNPGFMLVTSRQLVCEWEALCKHDDLNYEPALQFNWHFE